MSDSRDLIKAIMDEDFVSAKELTNSLLFSTVADNIEDVRAEVGQNLYHGDIQEYGMGDFEREMKIRDAVKKQNEEDAARAKKGIPLRKPKVSFKTWDPIKGTREYPPKKSNEVKESKASKDYDQDGEVEDSQAEVLGSRINAAVKAGKMTPAQAAKTKNKGKFR
jgi:hypothetical protein